MKDKKVVAAVAALVLAVVGYFFGGDAVALVKSALSDEVAPVTEVAPAEEAEVVVPAESEAE